MGPVTISERFVEQCSPVISSNYDTCGSVTRATVAHLTATQLTALFTSGGLFADLDAWFKHSVEMKACGVKRSALYDWIMANADRTMYRAALTTIKAVGSPSLVQPFIFGKQDSVVNNDYFYISNGWTAGAYSQLANDTDAFPLTDAEVVTATEPAGEPTRVVRVATRYSVPMDENRFRLKETIHIFTRAGNGASQHGQWVILAAAANVAKTFVDMLVQDINAGSIEPFEAAPTTGVMIPGINNINDYERWCQNLATIDPRKRVPFWVQTFRTGRCVDSEYKEVYSRLMEANPAFREFGDLPLAERNRQDEALSQRQFVNEFFFNKPLSANQTVDLWESLTAINSVAGTNSDPSLSGKLMSRRANFIGVKEQLRKCSQVFDLQNNPLNMQEFLDLCYNIVRARRSQGRKVTDLDWWTDSVYRGVLQTAFMQYDKDMYLEQLRVNVKINEEMKDLGISYDSYFVKRPAGVRINILSDEFFDDFKDQFTNLNIESVGTLLLCLDIGKPGPSGGTIYWAQIAANRKVYTTAKIEELAKLDPTYRCVMEVPSIEQTLKSETGTVIVECPLNSAWVENIGGGTPIPTTTGKTPSYTNLY